MEEMSVIPLWSPAACRVVSGDVPVICRQREGNDMDELHCHLGRLGHQALDTIDAGAIIIV